MPSKPKKGNKGKAAKGNNNNAEKEKKPGSDPLLLYTTYANFSKIIGLEPNEHVKKSLTTDLEHNPHVGKQILIDGSESSFGPGGCRALATALLGRGKGMPTLSTESEQQPIIYTALQELRIWKDSIGDDGTMAIAEILRLGGAELQLSYLELINNNIGANGAKSLGRSLSFGMNKSLLTLVLDFNTQLGVTGITALCKGLRTNASLKKLSLRYCNIVGKDGGLPLGEMLSFSKIKINFLDLTGNRLGGCGLLAFCESGFDKNQSLHSLNISDTNINSTGEDQVGITALANVLTIHPTLTDVNLLYNTISTSGAAILIPALKSNKKILSFKVDTSLPSEMYSALFRNGKKNSKKKSTGKKKKKKK